MAIALRPQICNVTSPYVHVDNGIAKSVVKQAENLKEF